MLASIRAHGEEYSVMDRSVDGRAGGLRKKLGSLVSRLVTMRGVGCRWQEI